MSALHAVGVRPPRSIDDALIQPYSGRDSRTSLEIYSCMALGNAQETYIGVIDPFPA